MKRHKPLCSAMIMIILLPFALGAAEGGFSSYFGTYGLSDYESDETKYNPYLQWGGNLYYQNINGLDDSLGYRLEFDHDPLLKYRLKSELEFTTPGLSLSFGPVFGIIHQSWSTIKPGFSGSILTQLPGKVFFRLGGELIPLGSFPIEEDYSTYSSFYTIGFYINRDHILCYFTQKRDNYTSISSDDTKRQNRSSYLFYTDFYEKNSILRVQSKLGYEVLEQLISDGDDAKISNILIGLKLDFSINGNADVFLGLDNRIYPMSTGSHELTSTPGYMYTFTTGLKWYQS